MSFRFTFLLSSYLLIFLGMFGLFLTEEISLPYLLLAGAGFVLGALRDVRGSKTLLPALWQTILLVAVFLHASVAVFVLKDLPLLALAQFLLALQAVKLLGPKKGRDWSLLYLLSFFSVVAASALSVEVFFAGIFVAYLFVAPWVLVLAHLKQGTETAGKDPDKEARLLAWPLFRLVGSINIILFLLTFVLFIAFPRFGVGLLGDLWASGSAVVGFSDRLTLGEVSKIQKNGAVAMRVSIDQPRPQDEKELYWRGVALDRFDGRKWEKSMNDGVPVRRIGDGYRLGEAPEGHAPLIRQKIVLEPTGSPVLFALDKPVMIFGRLGYLFRDSLGNVLALQPFPFQISYEVLSYTEPGWKDKPLDSNFLQLPALHPRIVTLSRRLTEGLRDEGGKARVLERFLRENYAYTLEDLPVGGNDPLADFLFEVRRGNCEYFASALAIMLRSLRIPARVVNGYLGGEWNPYGEYYLIRQSNAHSWVEAYLPNQGWVTLDPTPSVPRRRARALFASLTNFADFLRLNWYRYVINFGLADQYQLFKTLRQPHQWLGVANRGLSLRDLTARFSTDGKQWLELGIAVAALALGWLALKNLRGRKNAPPPNALHEATRRYRRLLTLCAKRGFKKKAAETPDEFSRRVGTQGNGLVDEFTSLYQHARFSGPKDFSAGLKKMDGILILLAKAEQNWI